MPTPPLSDELALQAAEAYAEHGTKKGAAEALGLAENTFRNRLDRAAERGMCGTKPVLPGFRLTKTTAVTNEDGDVVREFIQQRPAIGESFEVPDGHSVKGVSALVDATGRTIQQWVKTRDSRDGLTPEETIERLKTAMEGYSAAQPIPAPLAAAEDLLTLTPLADWHVGLRAWAGDTGMNWDLSIAENVIGRGIEDVVERAPSSGHAIVLGGGDLLHSDSNENKTAKSGNVLDVDGRYDKCVEVAGRLVVRTIDAHLRKHGHVTARILKGNHDEHSSVAIGYFLKGWYRNEPRVTVDTDASLFFWHRFGRVMIGATHGHAAKLQNMPSIMAHRRAEDWGATLFRYIHGFHLHHTAKYATEGNGCISEVHQTPTPQDAWHFGSGYLSGRSLQSISYHREMGEIGRVRVAMLDGLAANDNEQARVAA
jgi:hypothetical protein